MLTEPKLTGKYKSYLRIGTSSWKYDSWKGLIYDPDKKYSPYDYLSDYSKYFNTVEIDQWFWSLFSKGPKLPNPKDVRNYAGSVPDDFIFTVKVPNSITLTNFYAKQSPGARGFANQPNPHFLDVSLFKHFLELMEPMKNKLGPLMFEFEYLNKKKMASKEIFLEKLEEFFRNIPKGYEYAIETRNQKYLSDVFFDFLKSHKIGFVLIDGYYMIDISQVFSEYDVITSSYSIVRLHGPGKQKIEKRSGGLWNNIIEPKDDGLKTAASFIKKNVGTKIVTYVNVSNYYEGSAPLTIERLLKKL